MYPSRSIIETRELAGQHAYASLLATFLVTRPGKRDKAGLPPDPPPV